MGRLAQGHFDDVLLNKVKQACIHVLGQLNDANEIEQAFDLCPSISRRNRVILSFLRDADPANSSAAAARVPSSSSVSPPLLNRPPLGSMRSSREHSLGTDSVASLSAQRRRRAQQMQYVRDPNDSNDDSDSQATVGPSSSGRAHLDPASARNPAMSQPDYTFEQFVEHLDPTDKLLKRSLEIIIKETARQALARKRDPQFDPNAASTSSHDPAASLRSAIASSQADRAAGSSRLRDDAAFANRMSRVLNLDPASRTRTSDPTTADLDHTYQLLRSLRPATHSLTDHRNARSGASAQTDTSERRTLRDFFVATADRSLAHTQPSVPRAPFRYIRPSDSSTSVPARPLHSGSTSVAASSTISPDNLVPHFSQRRSGSRSIPSAGITPQTISARLAEATRRNAEAARTINEAERLRSSQFIRTSIESLRASLFQLHMDLACTQLQHAQREEAQPHRGATAPATPDIGASYALVMDTIELFDDTLRRLSCLVSNTRRDDNPASAVAAPPRNADNSQMRTSLWRARNLLLLSSMRRPVGQTDDARASSGNADASNLDAELRAHRHLLATIEESHWAKADAEPPSCDSIRAWRRKLAAWYHLDRDSSRYPDAPSPHGDREETYARWHPDLELPYALDDEILAPMTDSTASARPDPIADPHSAWAYVRSHDASMSNDLNEDEQVRDALGSSSVASALQRLLRVHTANRQATAATGDTAQHDIASSTEDAPEHLRTAGIGEADPDVSLTHTTSLSRRNAVRSLPLANSDASSIQSARSSLSLRRPRGSFGQASNLMPIRAVVQDDNDAVEEDVVETSMEIGTVPHSPDSMTTTGPFARPQVVGASDSSLLPPPDRPRAGRSGSFTFITTPAAVLRSGRRSESRSRGVPRSQSPAAASPDDADDVEVDILEERDSEAEEYIDLDLDLGMAVEDAFDFDLVDFLRTESRGNARRSSNGDDDEVDLVEASPPSLRRRRGAGDEVDDGASNTDIRVFVSGSGASTPAEARQATFEAYAQRARVLERRRRLERQRQNDEDGVETAVGAGEGSLEASPEGRRRRRGRNVGGDTSAEAEGDSDRRNSLPFPRTTER